MRLALTRDVPESLARCELTHLSRVPIDVARAVQQHREYEDTLRSFGYTVRRLPPADDLPDSVFVEDVAIVLDEIAVISGTRRGADALRPVGWGSSPATTWGQDHARIAAPWAGSSS